MKRMKKHIALFMALALAFGVLTGAEKKQNRITMKVDSSQAIVNGEYVIINEKDPSVTPIIEEGRAYVPVAFINKHFDTTIDINKVKAMSVDSTVFVPLRELVEEMDYSVYFKDGVIVINSDKNAAKPEESVIAEAKDNLSGLPKVGSSKMLNELLKPLDEGAYTPGINYMGERSKEAAVEEAMPVPAPSAAADMADMALASGEAGAGSDFSATNVQVQGVDEGDIIKTDGKYIYFSRVTATMSAL